MKTPKQPQPTKRFQYMRLAIALSGIAVAAQVTADKTCYLNIHGASSSFDQSYSVEEVQRVEFTEDALSVHFVDNPSYYEVLYSDLLKITFGRSEYTDVSMLSVTELSIKYLPSTAAVVTKSSKPIAHITVYNIQGVLLQYATPRTLEATLDLSALPSGVYIVRATSGEQTETCKIIK